MARKTITSTRQQDAWIAARIKAGSFANDSEAIRDPIGREHQPKLEIDDIRHASIDGEDGGEPEKFDFTAFKQRKAVQPG